MARKYSGNLFKREAVHCCVVTGEGKKQDEKRPMPVCFSKAQHSDAGIFAYPYLFALDSRRLEDAGDIGSQLPVVGWLGFLRCRIRGDCLRPWQNLLFGRRFGRSVGQIR